MSASNHHGKKGKCWTAEEKVKVCHKVEKVHPEKRCRVVVKYRDVCKKVKIVVQEVKVRDVKHSCRKDNSYSKLSCRWENVCINGKTEDKCKSRGCCSGTWVAARKKKICCWVKCPSDCKVDYCTQETYIVDRCEYVEVVLREPYFEKEEYTVDVKSCETVCDWVTKKNPHHDGPACQDCPK